MEGPVDLRLQGQRIGHGGQEIAESGGEQGDQQHHRPARQAHVTDALGHQVELGEDEKQTEEPQGGEHRHRDLLQQIAPGRH